VDKVLEKSQHRSGMVRVHQIAQTYGQRPSFLLFPKITNANFLLSVDNFVWELGTKDEIKGKSEYENSKMLENQEVITITEMLRLMGTGK
jgi:hypothetical protein